MIMPTMGRLMTEIATYNVKTVGSKKSWKVKTLEAVETVWRKMHIIGMRVALLFAGLALIFFLLGRFAIASNPFWGYRTASILLLLGVFWLLQGLFGLARSQVLEARRAHLRKEGKSYEIVIEDLYTLWFPRFGVHLGTRLKGYYMDASGQKRSVKSAYFPFALGNKKTDIMATVYVDPDDPQTYAVEVRKTTKPR